MLDTPNDLLIYGSPVSPFVRKVMAVAMEKGAGVDIEAVNIMDLPDWFPGISPMKRIPVLRDRSIAAEGPHGTLADSSAICAYLEKKHPAPAMYPAEPYAHGRAMFIEEFADTALAPAGGLGIFRPLFFSLMQGKEPDIDTARSAWAEKIPPVLDYLEQTLGNREWFAGDAFGIADISVTCCFMQIELVAHAPLDAWPALKAHHARATERNSIAAPFASAQRFIRKGLPDRFDLT